GVPPLDVPQVALAGGRARARGAEKQKADKNASVDELHGISPRHWMVTPTGRISAMVAMPPMKMSFVVSSRSLCECHMNVTPACGFCCTWTVPSGFSGGSGPETPG